MNLIDTTEQRIVNGESISYEEAVRMAREWQVEDLCELADRLRRRYNGNRIDTCSIMNARSGRCQEDCKWCSQSKLHTSDIEIYPLVGADEAVELATYNAGKGIGRFSLVTSGRTMSDGDIEKSSEIYRRIGEKSDIYLCASMGLLSREQLQKLYDAGVRRYHCNLETAPSYFSSLCSTHTTQDKIDTINAAREVGMEVCSGGIIGMGETMEHRVELAVTLRDMGIKSIPLNVLNPIPGTKLEGTPALSDDELLRSAAIFRIVNPEAHIRFAGGRTLFKHLERRLLHSGVSASILGDMLTTEGSEIDRDKKMFAEEGFTV